MGLGLSLVEASHEALLLHRRINFQGVKNSCNVSSCSDTHPMNAGNKSCEIRGEKKLNFD